MILYILYKLKSGLEPDHTSYQINLYKDRSGPLVPDLQRQTVKTVCDQYPYGTGRPEGPTLTGSFPGCLYGVEWYGARKGQKPADADFIRA